MTNVQVIAVCAVGSQVQAQANTSCQNTLEGNRDLIYQCQPFLRKQALIYIQRDLCRVHVLQLNIRELNAKQLTRRPDDGIAIAAGKLCQHLDPD